MPRLPILEEILLFKFFHVAVNQNYSATNPAPLDQVKVEGMLWPPRQYSDSAMRLSQRSSYSGDSGLYIGQLWPTVSSLRRHCACPSIR